ncbi:MAG: adenylyltransferase/cytidyltransferase family protein [Bacteroidetes bacterium]|nr:adenylyltransferase/cytidyltransferase family protein [Bacteroidota bacterium]
MVSPEKKVFVSGCFDLLHSGHVAFLTEASSFGDLYVGIGSDKTISELKGRVTINTEEERKYMLEALKVVKKCFVNSGSGILDFYSDMVDLKPDIFVVNEDGNTPEKSALCLKLGIDYKVLKRIPYSNLPKRTTTELRRITAFPYRIDIAGTWIDQPYVSEHYPGSAIVASIEPTTEFFDRSGMATSTRRVALEMWPGGMPFGDPENMAKMLFRFDNPPGKTEISGSQDALGIMLPGINKLVYNCKNYWPEKITNVLDEDIISWLESHLYLIPLWPRKAGYNVLKVTKLNKTNVKALADAADGCWEAIKNKDLNGFAKYFNDSFYAQVTLFPGMLNDELSEVLDTYGNRALGWKLSGAGGGGYLILISEKKIDKGISIKIRRKNLMI